MVVLITLILLFLEQSVQSRTRDTTFTHVLVDDTDISKATSAEDNGIYEVDLEGDSIIKIGKRINKTIIILATVLLSL